MKVLYDLQAYSFSPHGGVVRIFDEIFSRLARKESYSALLLKTAPMQRTPPLAPNVQFTNCPEAPPWFRNRRWAAPYFRSAAKRYWKRQQIDLFHPTFYPPDDRFPDIPTVITIHDLLHELVPGADDVPDRNALLHAKRRMIERAAAIICVSRATRDDLLAYYSGIKPERLFVVHNGHNEHFHRMDRQESSSLLNTVVQDSVRPFILYVGSRQKYKNFDRMVQAYGNWKRRGEVDLLVVGRKASEEELAFVNSHVHGGNVRFAGHVDDPTLCALYNSCAFFVYPSLKEGFGIPLLEAMCSFCPLCISDIPPFREVAESRPVYFNPLSVEDMTRAFDVCLEQGHRPDKLAESARHAKEFTWAANVEAVWNIYRKIVNV
jgi:glycosyltransferase involved in cell wall biosynthesis